MNTRVKFDKITGVFVVVDAKVVSCALLQKKILEEEEEKKTLLSPPHKKTDGLC